MESYLADPTQTIVVNNVRSATQRMKRGVPQGSVLGQILFLLYTTEIQEIIRSFGLESHVYADDTQLYFHCKPEQIKVMTPKLLLCIEAIRQWMSSHRLRLNPD